MNGKLLWEGIWVDFAERAERLALPGAAPRDAVDITLLWQLHGYTSHVPKPIAPPGLHLKELYSGSPWRSGRPWVAFVTINPSIDPDELFPSIWQFNRHRGDLSSLVGYFDERFNLAFSRNPQPRGRGSICIALSQAFNTCGGDDTVSHDEFGRVES